MYPLLLFDSNKSLFGSLEAEVTLLARRVSLPVCERAKMSSSPSLIVVMDETLRTELLPAPAEPGPGLNLRARNQHLNDAIPASSEATIEFPLLLLLRPLLSGVSSLCSALSPLFEG